MSVNWCGYIYIYHSFPPVFIVMNKVRNGASKHIQCQHLQCLWTGVDIYHSFPPVFIVMNKVRNSVYILCEHLCHLVWTSMTSHQCPLSRRRLKWCIKACPIDVNTSSVCKLVWIYHSFLPASIVMKKVKMVYQSTYVNNIRFQYSPPHPTSATYRPCAPLASLLIKHSPFASPKTFLVLLLDRCLLSD